MATRSERAWVRIVLVLANYDLKLLTKVSRLAAEKEETMLLGALAYVLDSRTSSRGGGGSTSISQKTRHRIFGELVACFSTQPSLTRSVVWDGAAARARVG